MPFGHPHFYGINGIPYSVEGVLPPLLTSKESF